MTELVIPNIELPNEHGACWACLDNGRRCDGNLPDCTNCLRHSRKCAGYGIRLKWPSSTKSLSERNQASTSSPKRRLSLAKGFGPSPSISASLSPFGLLPLENGYLNHYLRHVSSIALAVDYTENGYRSLLPMAMEEPALLNAMLAIAAAHRSKWQQVEDIKSRKYLRKALVRLQQVISDPKEAIKESTLAIMLSLVSYEVFNGTGRWKRHFQGIGGWLKLRGDCSNLSSFMKTWICMIDTQAAMNLGQDSISEVEKWLDKTEWENGNDPVIDPLFGCSTRLPRLMLEAARLYRISQSDGIERAEVWANLRERAEVLKVKIHAAALDIQSSPILAVTCGRSGLVAAASGHRHQSDHTLRMCATAEIFRHALLIYLFRAVNGPEAALDAEAQRSLDDAFRLLPFVPDAIGPGANLGWALVIIGSETEHPDLRQYLRCRWRGLTLLEMNNAHSGERLTEEVWRQRDTAQAGHRVHWQDVMRNFGGEQILV